MYYRYLLTTITTISTVTAVAIPQNQGQGQNQVYGQRPGIHGQSQNDLYSTVPIVIPTHNGDEIRKSPDVLDQSSQTKLTIDQKKPNRDTNRSMSSLKTTSLSKTPAKTATTLAKTR